MLSRTAFSPHITIPPNSDFPVDNLPFGVFKTQKCVEPRIGVAVGDHVLDLSKITFFLKDWNEKYGDNVFKQSILNHFISLGQKAWSEARIAIQHFLSPKTEHPSEIKERWPEFFVLQKDVTMLLPVQIGDYTDYYSSMEHATNVGIMFRGKDNALMPNWKYLPVAYHGRASSIVVSGTPIRRPYGQIKPNIDQGPRFDTCKSMDFELEMAFIIATPSEMGKPIKISEAENHIFGMVLMNDWSARDIQKWEYVPLGPFGGKNLGTSISPWIVTMEALNKFQCPNVPQNPKPFPYLCHENPYNFDIHLEVAIRPENSAVGTVITKSNFKYLYWSMKQQLVHHTITGCNMKTGDLIASGTISGPTPDSYGSLLELTWNGTKPLILSDGQKRTFLEDGDEVILKGYCKIGEFRIGFGECCGKLLPSLQLFEVYS